MEEIENKNRALALAWRQLRDIKEAIGGLKLPSHVAIEYAMGEIAEAFGVGRDEEPKITKRYRVEVALTREQHFRSYFDVEAMSEQHADALVRQAIQKYDGDYLDQVANEFPDDETWDVEGLELPYTTSID